MENTTQIESDSYGIFEPSKPCFNLDFTKENASALSIRLDSSRACTVTNNVEAAITDPAAICRDTTLKMRQTFLEINWKQTTETDVYFFFRL